MTDPASVDPLADSHEFESLIRKLFGSDEESIHFVSNFRRVLLLENDKQNLTRQIAAKDFYEGHVVDAYEVLKSGLVDYPAMDLGSGGGVPGLLCAGLAEGDWVLVDSEVSKAQFLTRAAEELEVSRSVSVFAGRGEEYLKTASVKTIVARAVGKVEKIYGWMQSCSTWNNLVLLKGPGWEDEWKEFQQSRHRGKLKIVGEHRYEVGQSGPELKKRVIVKLQRTAR